jgi:hypothetical protein
MALATPNMSAGAYVKEIDQSQRIANATTSIGVVVGEASQGPVNQRVLITDSQNYINTFGKPHPKRSIMGYSALTFLEEGNRLYVTRVTNGALTGGAYFTVDEPNVDEPILRLTNFDDGSNQPLGVEDPLSTINFAPSDPATENTMCFFCAIDPGKWNNRLYILIRPHMDDINASEFDPYMFYVDVYVDYQGTYQQPDESFLVTRRRMSDGYGISLYIEDAINEYSKLIRVKDNVYCPQVRIVGQAYEFIDGASDGSTVTAHSVANGWELYRDPELVDINILMNSGYPDPIVQRKMDSICRDRMDCVALLDVPSNKTEVADAIDYKMNLLNLDSSYSAIYSPDVKIYDKYNDIDVWVPLSGFAGAACAAVDKNAAVWFAPAGIENGSIKVIEGSFLYDQGARDALDEAGVNMIRKIPNIGHVFWAQQTMQSLASSLSFLNVRRLLAFLEKSLAVASMYNAFKPNDEILRAQLRDIMERFLRPIKNAGGLYAFSVECDERNNTPDIIASGDTIIDVYVDPIIMSKRIHLNATVLKTGGITFRESQVQY